MANGYQTIALFVAILLFPEPPIRRQATGFSKVNPERITYGLYDGMVYALLTKENDF